MQNYKKWLVKWTGTMDQINEIKGKMGTELSASATNIQNKAIEMNATRQDRDLPYSGLQKDTAQ